MGVGLLVGLAGCDPGYPLVLRNGLATPITVQTNFEGEPPAEGTFRPGEELGFLHPKGDLERVVVFSGGQRLHDLNKQALLDMRNSVPDPWRVIWNIQVDGIKPLSRSEVEQLE